jgi:nicotinamidase-related amidase
VLRGKLTKREPSPMKPQNALGLIRPHSATLLVIDVQERLMPVISESERVFKNVNMLLEGCAILGVDRVLTEQYPKGLGHTCGEVNASEMDVFEKDCFSCLLQDKLAGRLKGKKSLVVCGVEAHICVLKTVLDGLAAGFEVHVVADAVSSRTPDNHRYAINRMQQAGAFIATTEMILFQFMDYAGTDQFKQISRLIK